MIEKMENENGRVKMKHIWKNGMMGLVMGDVLGMPVQFSERWEIKMNPVKTVEGYGTYYMPPGTWSDDSSMAFATLDSIREKGEIDYSDIMDKFYKWTEEGEYTPIGIAFDQGVTCVDAIMKFSKERNYKTCGKTGEYANGNGALMRIMPVCLYAYKKVLDKEWDEEKALECIHQVGALTHNHLRSNMACGIYYYMVKHIIEGTGKLVERLQNGIDEAMDFYYGDLANLTEMSYYERIVELDAFANCKEEEIKTKGGYVVDSLEAAIWGLITTDTMEEALLKIVNLGGDTDTVAAIAGGLAGLYYGYESLPQEWRDQIVQKERLLDWCEVMEEKYGID